MTGQNQQSQENWKIPVIIGHVFFIVLIILAAFYYKERTLFTDCAFYVFEFISRGTFQIFSNKFLSAPVQAIPLLGIKMGWGLQAVLIGYSVSFCLLYYVYYIITAHVIGNKQAAVLLVAFIALFVNHTFFWIQSDFFHGMMLLFVFYALFQKDFSWGRSVMIFVLIALIILSHSLAVFPLVFLILYDIIRRKKYKDYFIWTIVIFSIGLSFLIWMDMTPSDMFEAKRLTFSKPFENTGEIFTAQSNAIFLKWLFTAYPLLLIGLAGVIVFYLVKKRFALLLLVIGFFVVYSQAVNLSFLEINPHHQFYYENFYLPLSVFVVAPLIFEILAEVRFARFLNYVLIGLIVIRILIINITAGEYSERISYLEKIIEKTKGFEERKFVVSQYDLDMKMLKMDWALVFETLLLSSLHDKNESRVIYPTTEDVNAFDIQRGPWVHHDFRPFNGNDLDKRYFNLPDQPYRRLYKSDLGY